MNLTLYLDLTELAPSPRLHADWWDDGIGLVSLFLDVRGNAVLSIDLENIRPRRPRAVRLFHRLVQWSDRAGRRRWGLPE